MSGYLDKDQFHTPLRTREHGALLIARSALRRIAQADLEFDDVKKAAEIALENIAVILGERS